jgi:predicted RNase H-like HicB family nuclease
MKRYFALLDGERGAYGVAFPDCPGCTAMGADENEAYLNGVEALGEWMHDARLADAAPEPRSIEALRSDAEVQAAIAEGAIFLSVPLVIEDGRAVKANISLDRGLLDAIDAAARRSGLTRSGFLASAAREKIAAAAR